MMAEQTIRVMCPNVVCRKVMSVPIAARGKVVQCPQCRKRIRIPLAMSSKIEIQAIPESEVPPEKKAG